MTAITLEVIAARQSELNELIEKFKKQPVAVSIPAVAIQLRPGERYAGAVLDEAGQVKHHLILMPERPTTKLNWDDAMEWAKAIGGALPNRQEQALLYANCKPHLEPAWHWSCQQHESDASYAWYCDFDVGYQTSYLKSYEGCAVSVRRT